MSNPLYAFVDKDLYYDRGDADEVENWLFWGPRMLAPYIRVLSPPCEHESPLDTAFGGLVLLTGEKKLTWFSGGGVGECPFYCRLYLQLQRAIWPEEWEIEWAARGLDSLMEAAGRKPETEKHPAFGQHAELFEAELHLLANERASKDQTIGAASIRYQDGSLHLYSLHDGDVTLSYLWAGPEKIVQRLAARTPRTELHIPGEGEPAGVMGGFHLDMKEKALFHWSHHWGVYSVPQRMWPGWNITDWENRFGMHSKATGGKLQLVYPEMSAILERMERYLVAKEPWTNDPYRRKYPIYDENLDAVGEMEFPISAGARHAIWRTALQKLGLDKPAYPLIW